MSASFFRKKSTTTISLDKKKTNDKIRYKNKINKKNRKMNFVKVPFVNKSGKISQKVIKRDKFTKRDKYRSTFS